MPVFIIRFGEPDFYLDLLNFSLKAPETYDPKEKSVA